MFKRAPEQMYRALTLHNNVIRHAKYVNCGSIIQQEGDSFTLAFHTAFDAVAFCLQVRNSLLLLETSSAAWQPSRCHQLLSLTAMYGQA